MVLPTWNSIKNIPWNFHGIFSMASFLFYSILQDPPKLLITLSAAIRNFFYRKLRIIKQSSSTSFKTTINDASKFISIVNVLLQQQLNVRLAIPIFLIYL